MAINLENGMFALHITKQAPQVLIPNGFMGEGTIASPYILTSDGTPMPEARLTKEAAAVIQLQIDTGKDWYSTLPKFFRADFFGTGKSQLYNMARAKSSSTVEASFKPVLHIVGSEARDADGYVIRTATELGYEEVATYADLANGGNFFAGVEYAAPTAYPELTYGTPAVGTMRLPVDFSDIYASARFAETASTGLLGIRVVCDVMSTLTDADIDITCTWEDADNPELSYKILDIKKAPGADISTATSTAQLGHGQTETVRSAMVFVETSNGGSGWPQNILPSDLALLSQSTLELAFPGKGTFVWHNKYTGDRATQVYVALCNPEWTRNIYIPLQ